MKKSRVLATFAASTALALGAAGCGDDDDAAEATNPATIVSPTTIADADAASTTPATDDASTTPPADTGSAATAAAPGSPPPAAGSIADPDVQADCDAFTAAITEAFADPPEAPVVGEEMSDAYKEWMSGAMEQVAAVDLQTGEVQSAADHLLDFGEQVADSETWTEELQESGEAVLAPFAEACAGGV